MICAYGNCQNEIHSGMSFKCTVSISNHGRQDIRASFCSYEHAELWLRGRREHMHKLYGNYAKGILKETT